MYKNSKRQNLIDFNEKLFKQGPYRITGEINNMWFEISIGIKREPNEILGEIKVSEPQNKKSWWLNK